MKRSATELCVKGSITASCKINNRRKRVSMAECNPHRGIAGASAQRLRSYKLSRDDQDDLETIRAYMLKMSTRRHSLDWV